MYYLCRKITRKRICFIKNLQQFKFKDIGSNCLSEYCTELSLSFFLSNHFHYNQSFQSLPVSGEKKIIIYKQDEQVEEQTPMARSSEMLSVGQSD